MSMLRLCMFLFSLLNIATAGFGIDSYSREDFPPGFLFGASTTAYQVEGAANEDGRSPSVWDTFCHEGGTGGAICDKAVDGYHKYKEDVKLMVKLGIDAYRFSISWSRLIPDGNGTVNPKGIQYYNNLINELVSNGIKPHALLVNFDHPQILEDKYEGWLNRQIVDDFTTYSDVCFREFGDRVSHWTTINEPNVFGVGSYDRGFTPPSRCSPPFGFECAKGNSSTEPYLAIHHILLAHATASKLYKTKYQARQRGYIGINVYFFADFPLTDSVEDVRATKRYRDFSYGWILNPSTFGDYPKVMKENVGSRLPTFTAEESELVKGSYDFIGVIHYTTSYVKDDSSRLEPQYRDYYVDMAVVIETVLFNSTADEFPIVPSSLQEVLEYIKQSYNNPPVYIYENGQRTRRSSSIEDVSRVNYLHGYIGSLLDAIRNGSNARGYFVWSFLDMVELLDGLKSSFGLYYVDLDDPLLKRQPKLSAHWYSNFLKGESVSLDRTIELSKNLSGLSDESLLQQVMIKISAAV